MPGNRTKNRNPIQSSYKYRQIIYPIIICENIWDAYKIFYISNINGAIQIIKEILKQDIDKY